MVMVRQFDEDVVLEKVLEVFWTKGWQATSMADLAGAANVQRGSLYHAYGSKEHLFLLAFDQYAERVLAESRAALDAPSAKAALQRFFDVSITSMTADSPPRGCFTTKTAIESGLIGSAAYDRVRLLLGKLETTVIDALSHAKIRDSLNTRPDKAAKIVIAFTRGLAVMERVHHDPKQLRAVSLSLIELLVKPS
ncbi:MAG: TetR/AcrR family transcriptional regulator [Comamonas sp.]